MLARSTPALRTALPRLLPPACLAVALVLVAACAPGDEAPVAETGPTTTSQRPPGADRDDPAARSDADADGGAGDQRTLRQVPDGVDELAFAADETWPSATATTPSASASASTPTSTSISMPAPDTSASSQAAGDGDSDPSGSAASAGGTTTTVPTGSVTTAGPPAAADVGIYTGVLGTLGPDQVVTAAVAAPPEAVDGVLPLTGLAGTVPTRPAVVVKVDNGSRARPQTGLNRADLVIEEEVEGGITRFAAVFHSTSGVVGPIRSARTTDIGILGGLGSPLLMYSGANQVTDALIRAQAAVQNRNAGTSSGYWRSSSRRAPSNLYSDTGPHWASAAGGPPPPQFAYRADGEPVGGVEASSFRVAYRASRADWTWDGTAWLRSQGGRSHRTASGERVSAANVVVIEATEVATGMVDSSGSNVPEFVFVGTGRATVFTAGRRIDGTWTRPTLSSVATLTAADGSVIALTPGRTWIELIGADRGLLQ